MLEALELRRLRVTTSKGLRWEEFDIMVNEQPSPNKETQCQDERKRSSSTALSYR